MTRIKTQQLLGISLALVMVIGSTPLGFSEPLRVQLEQGVEFPELQCDNPSHVLVLRTNGNVACVSEKSAEKLGWKKVKQTISEVDSDSADDPELYPTKTETLTINVSSDVLFEDDGREYPLAVQRAPMPTPIYDRIMESMNDGINVSAAGLATITNPSHEKYSVNPGVGLYAEDWMPSHIPDGQRLLYTTSNCYEISKQCSIGIRFVPNTFVLYENATNKVLDDAKGINIGVTHHANGVDEIEDGIELLKEIFGPESGGYGEFREMTRDGKTVLAHEGGNHVNRYAAILGINLDEFTYVSVRSYYHTLDELIPIFDSIYNEYMESQ